MKQVQTILQQHIDELTHKGYDEKTLANHDTEGRLHMWLENKLIKSMTTGLTDSRYLNFFVSTTGFFNDKSDVVSFRFHFQFTPDTQQLNLKSLASKMEGAQKLFFLLTSDCLPHSQAVYQSLRQSRTQRMARHIVNSTLTNKHKRQKP